MREHRHLAVVWLLALLLAWLWSLVFAQPVAAQSEITPSTPCFASINLTNLNTGGNRGITNQPVISGNGARVAFWSVNNLGGNNPDGNIEVFVRDTGSNSVVQLTNSVGSILGGFNLEPSINTAGTHIAFYSDRDLVEGQNADGNFEIFLARRSANGTWAIRQITDTEGSANLFPSINAAGDRIAFVSDDSELHNVDQSRSNPDRNFEIFLATIESNGSVQFRQITNTGAGVTNDQPVINAAGTRIAYTASTGQTAQIFVWDQNQNAPAQLTQSGNNDQPSISADGTNIVYISTTSDDRSRVVLHTLSADGSESRAEVIVPAATNTSYRSPSISGDGKRVVYVAEQGTGAAIQINVLLYDVNTGLGVPISEVGGGTGEQPAISSDGTRVTFVGVQAVGGSTDNVGSDIYLNECPQADLSLEFVDSPPSSVLAGVDVIYRFEVTNHGPSVAQDVFFLSNLGNLPGLPANVSRLLPPGCTVDANTLRCPLGNLGIDASKVFTFGYDIPSNAGLSDIVSAIEVGANVVDSNPANNTTGEFRTRIFEESALSLTVIPDRAEILAGSSQVLTYDLVVTNGGPSQARSVRITDTLPTGSTFDSIELIGGGAGASCPAQPSGNVIACQLGNLTAGNIATVRIRVRANPDAPATLVNVATVRSLTQESDLSNNTVTTQTTVRYTADMAITKTASAISVTAGTEITYTLTFTNRGPAHTDNVTVIDTLPMTVTYVRSVLPAGASCTPSGLGMIVTCNFTNTYVVGADDTFSIVGLVHSDVPAGTITNTATVRSRHPDPNPSNDETPPVPNQVTLLSDLVITKTVNKQTPDIFEVFTYTVKLRNAGPSQAYNVVVTDQLPLELTFVGATATVGSYNEVSGEWTIGTLPVADEGDEEILTISVSAIADAGGDTKTNTATAATTNPEPDPDLPSSASVEVVPQRADVQVLKSSQPTPAQHVVAGERLTYTLSVRNNGPTPARSVLLTDVLPANVFLVDVIEPAGRAQCAQGATITCAVGNMANGETLTYRVVVTRELKGMILNTVRVSSATPDTVLGNNTANHSIMVDAAAPDHLVFTNQPPPVLVVGQVFTPAVTVEVRDRFDNLIDTTEGSTDTIRLTPYRNVGTPCTNVATPNALQNREADAVGGVAIFPNLTYTVAETIRLRAHSIEPGHLEVDACSNPVVLNPDTVKILHFTTPERGPIAGAISPIITVLRTDQFGNDSPMGDFTVLLSDDSPTGVFLDKDDGTGVEITSTVMISGEATASFYYTDTVAGTYVITASAPGVTPAVQIMTVVAAPAEELLVIITAPLTTTAGVSSDLFTVQRTDRFGNPNFDDPPVTVNLATNSTTGQGVFLNAANDAIVTQVTIEQTHSTTQFRYRDTIADTYELSVTDAAGELTGDTVTVTVVPSTTHHLLITSPAQTKTAGDLSDPIRVVRQDFFGNNNFDDPSLQVDLSTTSTSGTGEFRATPSGSSTTFVTITKGSDHVEFFYRDERADTFTLTTSATGGIISDSQEITFTPDAPEHLAILTTTTVITAGAPPFEITIQRQDQFDNPAPDGPPLEVFLESTSPKGTFYELGAMTEITKVIITETDASFRYQDFQQGEWLLTFSDNDPMTNFDVTQTISVTAAVPHHLVYLQAATEVTAGIHSTIFEVERQDEYDNPYTGPEPLTVYLTSTSPGQFKFIHGINGTDVVTNMVIEGGASTTTFYYTDDRAGSHLITAYDLDGLVPATTTITVLPGAAYKLVITDAPLTATAGITSGVWTVQVQDFFGNPVTPSVDSPIVVGLSSTGDPPVDPPARFANEAGDEVITNLEIAGTSTGKFRFYYETAGPVDITASAPLPGDPASRGINIVPASTSEIVFTAAPVNFTAGVTSTQITVERRDKFGNPNFNDPALTLDLTSDSTGTHRFIHGTSDMELPGGEVVIANGAAQASFRYYDEARAALRTITVTPDGAPSIQPIQLQRQVLGAAAVRLKLSGPATQTAGDPQQYTIEAFDAFDNLSDPYTGTHTLTFGGAGDGPEGAQPTVTDQNGTPVPFGNGTDIRFEAGVAVAGGVVTLYDAAVDVVITATDGTISATGTDAHTVTVEAAALHRVQAETTEDGAEVAEIVPAQTIIAGNSVTLWAVGRDQFGNSLGAIDSPTWVMTTTGGVAQDDLSTSGSSATFTGELVGTAIIEPRFDSAIPVPSGIITVVTASAVTVAPETKPDGSGEIIPAQNLSATFMLTAYAVSRDQFGNFTGLREANWEMVSTSGGVNTANNLAPTGTSEFTVFTAKQLGAGEIRPTAITETLTSVDSGLITVIPGPAATFLVEPSSTNDMAPGVTRKFHVTAKDAYNNTATSYSGEKQLIFSGPQPSTRPVTPPTVVDKSNLDAIPMGQPTAMDFNNGVAVNDSNRLNVTLYHAPLPDPAVTITVTDGPISGSYTINVVAITLNKLSIDAPTTNLVAGQPVSLTITAEDAYGNRMPNYDNDKQLRFTAAPENPGLPGFPATVTNKDGSAVSFNESTTINFTDGLAVTSGGNNGVMRLYKTGTFTISAAEFDGDPAASPHGSKQFTVTNHPIELLSLNLNSPQTNRAAFSGGTNTVSLSDLYGNLVPPRPVTITTSLPGVIIIEGSNNNNVLAEPGEHDLDTGTADLSDSGLKMRYEGPVSATATFTATTINPLGGLLTSAETIEMYAGPPAFFRILGATETDPPAHSLTVVEGQPISLTLQLVDMDGNVVTHFTGDQNPIFTLSPNPDPAGQVTDNDGDVITINGSNPTTISFVNGVSNVEADGDNGQLTLSTEGTYTLTASNTTPLLTTQPGYELVIEVVAVP